MKKVERGELVDYATYEDGREAFRARVMQVKAPRRVHVGDYLTMLFENHLTVLYQIQEMMRAERTVREADILHEMQTYNELLGDDGELGCTLLIEIEDAAVRDQKLQLWWNLPEKIAVVLDDGTIVPATFDERQRGDGRVSSVHYLKFNTHGAVPVGIRIDLPDINAVTNLTPEQRTALAQDLA